MPAIGLIVVFSCYLFAAAVMKPLGGLLRARQRLVNPQPASSSAPEEKWTLPWRRTRRIASGGRLTLFRAATANNTGPGCYVLKTTQAGCAPNNFEGALLSREATVAAQADHPHLNTVLASDLARPHPYLLLPYLEGITLRRLLAVATRLPAAQALSIGRQVALALQALHAAGWLHGQVRPEHIIVSPQGHATLIDLTQARRLESSECAAGGTLALSPAYAAPEMFSSRRQACPAADIYALGIVLFESLAGHLPFAAALARRLADCHRREAPPDLRPQRPELHLETCELIRRMLAKEPLRRPSSEQLVRWLAEVEIAELMGGSLAETCSI